MKALLLTFFLVFELFSAYASDFAFLGKDTNQFNHRLGLGIARRGVTLSVCYDYTKPNGFIYGIDFGYLNIANGYKSNGFCTNLFAGYRSLNRKRLSINHTLGIGYNYSTVWKIKNNITSEREEIMKFVGGPSVSFQHFFLPSLLTEFQIKLSNRFSFSPEAVFFLFIEGNYTPYVLPFFSLYFSYRF
jgi:hypothetical protein